MVAHLVDHHLFAISYVYFPSFVISFCLAGLVFHFSCHRTFLGGCPVEDVWAFAFFLVAALKTGVIVVVVVISFVVWILFGVVGLLLHLRPVRRMARSPCQKLLLCTHPAGINLFFHILYRLLWPSG